VMPVFAGRLPSAAAKAREEELMPPLIRFLLAHPELKAREKVRTPCPACFCCDLPLFGSQMHMVQER